MMFIEQQQQQQEGHHHNQHQSSSSSSSNDLVEYIHKYARMESEDGTLNGESIGLIVGIVLLVVVFVLVATCCGYMFPWWPFYNAVSCVADSRACNCIYCFYACPCMDARAQRVSAATNSNTAEYDGGGRRHKAAKGACGSKNKNINSSKQRTFVQDMMTNQSGQVIRLSDLREVRDVEEVIATDDRSTSGRMIQQLPHHHHITITPIDSDMDLTQ